VYEVFEHTADVGLRIRADSLESLLVDAARGLFSLLVVNPAAIQPVQEKTIHIGGAKPGQYDYLLFDWLNELLYLFETEGWLLCAYDLTLTDGGLTAVCRGELARQAQHRLDHEVKAITYHGLTCVQGPDGWTAEVIVDI
jgi:SHS2 domain-containing protein